jgi:hypothetical protein
MSDVNLPCVSLSTGTLSPDLRVDYQYGMVLGLNEFLQEQVHNLFLDQLHERALHGYGTVTGVQVSTAAASDDPNDVVVTVDPGILIDQWGRPVVIRTAQCARIGAWLAAQETANPGTIASHLGPSGELVISVVTSYADCPDDLVPIPGQPCSSSAQLQAPSRLRDAWDIELRWAAPEMPAWDAVRRLAELLDSVELVPGLPATQSSEAALIDAVLALPGEEYPELSGSPPPWPPGSPPSAGYQLPAETAAEAFDRILTVWVTEVRPQLGPDLIAPDPSWDPSVLLSTLVVTPAAPFSVASPVIDSFAPPDDTGRPYLLATQLIQELRRGGAAAGAAQPPPPPMELATVGALAASNGVPTLTAWFHLDQPVSLTAPVTVVGQDGQSGSFSVAPLPPGGPGTFSNQWELTAPAGFTATDGELLAVEFVGSTVQVGTAASTLASQASHLGLIDRSGTGDVTVYAPVVQQAPPPALAPATVPFVTLTFVPGVPVDGAAAASWELWFHLQPTGGVESVNVVRTEVAVFNDTAAANTQNRIYIGSPALAQGFNSNVFTIPLTEIKLVVPAYLRFLFDANNTVVATSLGDMSLTQWVQRSGIRYFGWVDGTPSTVVAFLRVASLTSGVTSNA